jgi:hypothetical protein
MGSPYLNSGEAIVLTTNRVSANAVPYDVMLTTERIFFIDNRNARFEPRIIPLSAILSVQGGKTPAHDPVIALLFRTGEEEGTRQPLNLVFSQNPNENRKPERDDWMRTLIQLSIHQHEKEVVTRTPAVREETGKTGLRPSVRHGVAPDMVRPLSNMADHRKEPAPVTIIPDDIEGGEIPMPPLAVTPVREESAVPEPEDPRFDLVPVPETLPSVPAIPTRIIIPQIIEELLPANKTTTPLGGQPPEPAAGIDPEALFRAIPTLRSMTVTEERTPGPVPGPETVPVPEVTGTGTASVQETGISPPTDAESRELADIIRALHTASREPVTMEPPGAAMPDTLPEPAPEIPQEGIHGIPEPHITSSIPENGIPEPVRSPVPETVFRQEPAAREASPVRHPLPPAREIRSLRTTLTYAAVLILVIALVAAGALLLLPRGPGQTNSPVSPIPAGVQVTTLPAETVQTTPLPPATLLPVTTPPPTTRIVTPVPPLAVSSVPQAGVWVRVNSTAYYVGTVGNTELMQQVSGRGDTFYKVLWNDRPVQVSIQKQDNSGATLAVAIYRNGTLIGSRSITSPMGAVDLLIDPLTARAPGLTENDTLPEHAAKPSGLENY